MRADRTVVTAKSLDEEEVVLLLSSLSESQRAVRPERRLEFQGSLMYEVEIKNETDNFLNSRPMTMLGPKKSLLLEVSPGAPWDDLKTPYATALLDFDSRQREIQIAVDAVVFADGAAAGPNHSHWIERWRAEIDGMTEVYKRYTDAPPAEGRAVLSKLAEPAFSIHRKSEKREPLNYGAFLAMAHHGTAYAECLELAGRKAGVDRGHEGCEAASRFAVRTS